MGVQGEGAELPPPGAGTWYGLPGESRGGAPPSGYSLLSRPSETNLTQGVPRGVARPFLERFWPTKAADVWAWPVARFCEGPVLLRFKATCNWSHTAVWDQSMISINQSMARSFAETWLRAKRTVGSALWAKTQRQKWPSGPPWPKSLRKLTGRDPSVASVRSEWPRSRFFGPAFSEDSSHFGPRGSRLIQ